jgi:magnesium transporter
MKYFTRCLTNKVGLPPGVIVYTGTEEQSTGIELFKYDEHTFERTEINSLSEIKFEEKKVNWLNISGFGNQELIKEIIAEIGIHNIFAEDIFNMDHLPKYEEHGDSILFILKSYIYSENRLKKNHCSLYLYKNVIISFQEIPNTFLDKKVERISAKKGRARYKNADYMFFVLIDAFIDSYYSMFEEVREEISRLEETLLTTKKKNCINEIYELNKKLNYLRKEIIPLRDALRVLLNDEPSIIDETNYIYFRDCVDHINELIQFHESFGGLVKGLIDLNENNINSNTNEVMKVLTIIASIFIPLSFIAGLYGMNFEYIPELKFEYGYFAALGMMGFIASGLLVFMKIKKWF